MYKKRASTAWSSLDTMDCSEETPLVEDKTTLKRRKKTKPLPREQIPVVKMEVEEEEKEEEPDALILLIKKTIDTIMLEEAAEMGNKMDRYRGALSRGILKVAEKMDAAGSRVKLHKLVDAMRLGWKEWKTSGDEKVTLDTFMRAMDNEHWFTS